MMIFAFWCMIWHRWWYWYVLRIRTISYMDWINGEKQRTDYYCCKCEREWTVTNNDY